MRELLPDQRFDWPRPFDASKVENGPIEGSSAVMGYRSAPGQVERSMAPPCCTRIWSYDLWRLGRRCFHSSGMWFLERVIADKALILATRPPTRAWFSSHAVTRYCATGWLAGKRSCLNSLRRSVPGAYAVL